MLLLLSLSSTEKQEAQNQFGLEVGWERASKEEAFSLGRVWSTLNKRLSCTGLGLLLGCSFLAFLDAQRNPSVREGFWLSAEGLAYVL